MYGVNEDYHGIFDSVCPESSPRQPEQASSVARGGRYQAQGRTGIIQGYRDRDRGDDVLDSGSDIVCGLCIQCLSLFRVTLSGALSLSPRPGPPSRDGRV